MTETEIPVPPGPNLVPFDGEVYWHRRFYPAAEADHLLAALSSELAWREERILIFGKPATVPRLMCWYGDAAARYRYSGVDHEPLPWTPSLSAVRATIEGFCGAPFNSVLANYYRNGRDSMGCHADDEKELGTNPVIASLSLGASRLFRLYHQKPTAAVSLNLGHGDLLIMAGSLQHHWRHALPKSRQQTAPRINLTFRNIIAGS